MKASIIPRVIPEGEARDRLAAALSSYGVPSDQAPEAIEWIKHQLCRPPISAPPLVAMGCAWTSQSQEVIRFRTWCLKHPRKCRKVFAFVPNRKMSAIQCFHTALDRSLSIAAVPALTFDGHRAWAVFPGDRAVVQEKLSRFIEMGMPYG